MIKRSNKGYGVLVNVRKDIDNVMGAFTGTTAFFGKSLCEIAEELKYSDDLIYILQNQLDKVKELYPDTYNCVLSCKHQSDNREPFDYAKDLIASWIIEDYLEKYLGYFDISIKLDGADRKRTILKNSKISATADYLVIYKNKTRKVELMNDYRSFWKHYETLHLRDNKYDSLFEEEAILLAISVTEFNFRIFDFLKGVSATYLPNHHAYGDKPAYSIRILQQDMHELSIKAIADELKLHF